MKSRVLTAAFIASSFIFLNCSGPNDASESKEIQESQPALSQKELVERGKYLTIIGGCNDCHSPKMMTPEGPAPDTTRLLSGHPSGDKIGAVPNAPEWIKANPGFTAYVGPWGISYAANISPDETGIGNWKFEQFETAMRKGKSKGLESNRPLLPPMPWQMYRHMTDDDLKAVFAYLKSLPPIHNLVPEPISPDKLITQSK
jgi:hypothetical protein